MCKALPPLPGTLPITAGTDPNGGATRLLPLQGVGLRYLNKLINFVSAKQLAGLALEENRYDLQHVAKFT
jgi:hypothetical protein